MALGLPRLQSAGRLWSGWRRMYDTVSGLLLGRGRRVLAGYLVLLSLAACGAPYQLSVRNVDAPAVTLIINGQGIADLPCGVGRMVVRPGENAPTLPWRLELRRASGEVFASIDIDGTHGPEQELVVRDIGAIEVPPADPADAAFAALPCPAP